MYRTNTFEIIRQMEYIGKKIKTDTGGGCPLAKSVVMGFLVHRLNLKSFVEIGVYRGKGLLPVATAIKANQGIAFGIDPYSKMDWVETDIPEHLVNTVNNFLNDVNLDEIYEEVVRTIDEMDLFDCVRLLRKKSSEAHPIIKRSLKAIDMLHIDGNHDADIVSEDIENYLPLLSANGIIIFDDIDWPGVKKCYDRIKASGEFKIIMETEYFSIMKKLTPEEMEEDHHILRLINECQALYEREKYYEVRGYIKFEIPIVSVGVTAYKHERYIRKCLESIFSQKGSFKLRVVIAEDCSDDNTAFEIQDFLNKQEKNDKIECLFIKNHKNLGLISNLKQVFENLGPCDYFTFCEGDDYWSDPYKIQKNINFLNENHNCAMTFNRLMLYWNEDMRFEEYNAQKQLKKNIFSAYELADFNFIGTLSCSFYTGIHLPDIDDNIFKDELSDWIFNIYFSYRFGDIGMIDEPITVYRKHNKSAWTGMDEAKRCQVLAYTLDLYNGYFNYDFNYLFEKQKMICAKEYQYRKNEAMYECDLLIIDDVFPNPLSGFRYEEFSCYLEHYSSVFVLNCGPDEGVLGMGKTSDVIRSYQLKNSEHIGKVMKMDPDVQINAKLAYFVFINNAYQNLEYVEKNKIPFVVTLYTGGGLFLDSPVTDNKLRRIFASPCFVKVIATQKRAYEYLIEKELCHYSKIEFIFGIVTPKAALDYKHIDKKHWGTDKNVLDICFVAFKYTDFGVDKGYDIFIKCAHKLCKKYDNIVFHVAGNFDEKVIDITEIKDRIHFYGKLEAKDLDRFFSDKDIILSPNISGKIQKGSFDSFPTGSCIEGALRKTAIFCTDEFGSNQERFIDKDEIVVIPYDCDEIVSIIETYYNDPETLKNICEKGANKVRTLYGYEAQLRPRIELLEKEINISKAGRKLVFSKPTKAAVIIYRLKKVSAVNKIFEALRKVAPRSVKRLYRKILIKLCGDYS